VTKFPVYQIDFGASAAGKRVAATKRRIRWYEKSVCVVFRPYVFSIYRSTDIFFGSPGDLATPARKH
jgi:hypothetical protein